jgi:Holliday junction resolvasome RuvABC endonuclease subunit
MGVAVVKGYQLLAFSVVTLRNGTRPYDVIGQARRAVLDLIKQFGPQVVVIEAPLMLPTTRAALLSVIAQEVTARCEEVGAKVVQIGPREARQRLTGNRFATKIDVAEYLVAHGFPQLKDKIPKRPARAVLGLRPKDKYWLHAFDALALAACCPS